MRARMSLVVSGQVCELREVVLRNKPNEMIAASPKATVPVLIDVDGVVRDESLEIMLWAFDQNDPDNFLTPDVGDCDEMLKLITMIDGAFKGHLDRYKYRDRYPSENNGDGLTQEAHRDAAMTILNDLEERLQRHRYLFGARLSLADIATAPFVRQFANVDKEWFSALPYPKLQKWLTGILESELFLGTMQKYEPWVSERAGVKFPAA